MTTPRLSATVFPLGARRHRPCLLCCLHRGRLGSRARAAPADHPDSLCDVEVAARGRCVEGRPALVVLPVHVGPALHQEPHHVEVLVDAGLRGKRACSRGTSAGLRAPAAQRFQRHLSAQPVRSVQGTPSKLCADATPAPSPRLRGSAARPVIMPLNLIRSAQWGWWHLSTGRPAPPKEPVFTARSPAPCAR